MPSKRPGAGETKHIFEMGKQLAASLAKQIRAAEPFMKKTEQVLVEHITPKLQEHQHVALLVTGLVVHFHGIHFSKLIIACQTVRHMSFAKVTSSLKDVWADIGLARAHLKKAEEEFKGKTSVGGDAAALNDALKLIDPDKLTSATVSAWKAMLACVAVLGNSVAQACAIGAFVSKVLIDHADDYLKKISAYEGLEKWLNFVIKSAVHAFSISLAWLSGKVALSLHHVILGSSLIVDGALRCAEKFGKIEAGAADMLRNGRVAHGVRAVLALIGFYWQMTSETLGVFIILHFPLVAADYILSKLI